MAISLLPLSWKVVIEQRLVKPTIDLTMKTAFLTFALFTGLLYPCVSQAATLTIKGSDTMVVLAQRWADAFMQANPGIQVQVTGGGSGTGIAALLNRTTDLAVSSRPIRAREVATAVLNSGQKPAETTTALDGIGIVVHKENPVEALSMEQLEAIFTGKITNWKEVGGPDLEMTVYSRENNSGTYAFFRDHVLNGQDFSQRAQTMVGTAALMSAVSQDPRGIGYGGIGYTGDIRVLPVIPVGAAKPVPPTEENVISRAYPISRELFIYVDPVALKPESNAFIAFVLGADGQRIVREVGFYPLSMPVAAGEQAVASVSAPNAGGSRTGAVPAVAPAEAPAQVTAQPAIGTEGMNGILAIHLHLVERERLLAEREVAIAKREVDAAMRDMRSAEREAAIARRESALAEASAELAKREGAVAAALGLAASN